VHREFLFLPEALADIQSAYQWYEDQEAGLGQRFLKHLDSTFELIAAFPWNYPLRTKAYRRGFVDKFPYAVYFKLHEEKIVVGYIFHTSRNPKRLPTRLG